MLLAITVVISGLPTYNAKASNQFKYVVSEAAMEADDVPETEQIQSSELEAEIGQIHATTFEDMSETEESKQIETAESEIISGSEETEQIQSAVSETTFADEEILLYSMVSDDVELEFSDNAKMAGSNGILYEDVVYLSEKTVLSMDEETQNIYYNICDGIASCKESGFEIQDVVIAVDAEGTIYYSSSVPMTVLEKIQAEMAKGISRKLDLSAEIKETGVQGTEESKIENTEQKELLAEESAETKESLTEGLENEKSKPGESKTEESKTEGFETEESTAEQESEKESVSAESSPTESSSMKEESESKEETTVEEESESKEDITVEEESESKEETTVEEESETETISKEESSETGQTEIEETEIEEALVEEIVEETDTLITENSLEIDAQDLILTEENMDYIPDLEEETFDEVESVRVKNVIDLGYGISNGTANNAQISSVLPTEGYFYNQLTAAQKKYYNAAKVKFLSGNNSFSYTGPYLNFNWEPVCHAVSALFMTYPDKMDWVAKPGNIHMRYSYRRGSSTANFVFMLDKSKFYSGSLNSKAKTQIQTLANAAQQYAIEHYPQAPVYGIITYFDDWICDNNYYNYTGTEEVTNKTSQETRKIYYYCHSAYGILLNGYGVCESYAKAMSRLLDAIGIPNTYVFNKEHAWNYVQMPNGNWYMVDSTLNDGTVPNKDYFLVPDDGRHQPTGTCWTNERTKFKFPTLAASRYEPNLEKISFTIQKADLKPNETMELTLNDGDFVKSAPKTWTSSNSKVAKVSSKGKITAVAPGTATITLAVAGMTTTCEVFVDQVKAIVSANTNKTSDTISFGIVNGQTTEARTIVLNVSMGNSPHTAEWMLNNYKAEIPKITYTNKKVNVAQASVEGIWGNQIALSIQPVTAGTTNIKVSFAGKTATIRVAAGNAISPDWFEIAAIKNGATPYTGEAIRPKVTKTIKEKITYKVTYLNNKNAGTATVKITGTGKYGGEIIYPFEITPIDISNADFSKPLKAKVYNGGVCAPATTVKLGKKTLKINIDYTILYDGRELKNVPAKSSYTISVKGKGNYTGTVSKTQNYTVNKNTIAKVTAACPSFVKYTGAKLNPVTVKIGKNVLPKADYTIMYHQGSRNGTIVPYPLAKGKYTAIITVSGDNVIPTAKKTEIIKTFTVK